MSGVQGQIHCATLEHDKLSQYVSFSDMKMDDFGELNLQFFFSDEQFQYSLNSLVFKSCIFASFHPSQFI